VVRALLKNLVEVRAEGLETKAIRFRLRGVIMSPEPNRSVKFRITMIAGLAYE
jgi:hypothetical protein